MAKPLDILIVEDIPEDAQAIEKELEAEGIEFVSRRVETRQGLLSEIQRCPPDIVLSDFTLPPDFNALEALRVIQDRRLDIPFILVTGNRSEEVAVECIKAGADDYILKASLRRLASSIQNTLKKRAAERERAQALEALRALPGLILQAQEAERRRVARDLHDSVNQILSSAKFRFQSLEERLRSPDDRAEAAKARLLLERAIQEVRLISHNLRPSELDDLGLMPALRTLTDEFTERARIPIRFLPVEVSLSKEAELHIYRILQEGLANVEKHARASTVLLTFAREENSLLIRLEDDGQGMSATRPAGAPGMGLVDMKERAAALGGVFRVGSMPGRGTALELCLPCKWNSRTREKKVKDNQVAAR